MPMKIKTGLLAILLLSQSLLCSDKLVKILQNYKKREISPDSPIYVCIDNQALSGGDYLRFIIAENESKLTKTLVVEDEDDYVRTKIEDDDEEQSNQQANNQHDVDEADPYDFEFLYCYYNSLEIRKTQDNWRPVVHVFDTKKSNPLTIATRNPSGCHFLITINLAESEYGQDFPEGTQDEKMMNTFVKSLLGSLNEHHCLITEGTGNFGNPKSPNEASRSTVTFVTHTQNRILV